MNQNLVLRLAALCHDMGKPSTTAPDLTSHGHADAGVPVAESFLRQIGAPNDVVAHVLPLVREHMVRDIDRMTDGAVRRLGLRLRPATIEQLAAVIRADGGPNSAREADTLLARAVALGVKDEAPKPLVLGRHLIARGMKPGPEMGKLLAVLFEAQLSGVFMALEGGLAWIDKAATCN